MKLRLVEKQNLKETDYNYLNKEIQTTVYDAFDGTDFMISGVELMEDGRIIFDVVAMGPDGEMEREAELYVPEINYLDAVREACENWMSDHSTPDSFYESKLKDSEESEATQTEDIAKKEEYKKMVEPSFKVGKRIKK